MITSKRTTLGLSTCLIVLTILTLLPMRTEAVDGTWIANADGKWGKKSNWAGNAVANGAASVTNITANITANRSVTLNLPVILGTLNIGDPNATHSFTIGQQGVGNTLTFNNNGSAAALTQTSTSKGDSISCDFLLNDNATISNASTYTLTLSGVISGSKSITICGVGVVTLSGANLFTGGVTVNNRVLKLENDGALNSTTPNAVDMENGTLQINGKTVTAADLKGNGTVENANATAGNLTINKASGSSTLSAVVRNGTGGGALVVIKKGSGTLLLTGANTYSGPTTIEGGALGGAGCSRSATTVKSGAKIAPGSSIGTFNTGNLMLEAGSAVDWEYDDTTADLVASGTLAFANPVTVYVKKIGSVVNCERTLFTFSGSAPDPDFLTFDLQDAPGVTAVEAYIDGPSVKVLLMPEPGLLGFAALLIGLRASLKRRGSAVSGCLESRQRRD